MALIIIIIKLKYKFNRFNLGTAKGVVIACGDNTVMGRIAGLASSLDSRPTPIAREIIRFVNFVNITAIIIGILLFIIALMMGCYWLDAIIFMIGWSLVY